MRCVAAGCFIVAACFASTAAAYACSYSGGNFNAPKAGPFMLQQVVPQDHGLDGDWNWLVTLCAPETPGGCTTPAGYITQISATGPQCQLGFNEPVSQSWTPNYGGQNAWFQGTATNPGDRKANVTLICDPSATTLTPEGRTVIAEPSNGGTVYSYQFRFKFAGVCGGGPNPNPTPPPPGPPGAPGAPEEEEKSSVVAILFIVVVFVGPAIYVGAFVAYNKFKLQKTGLELLPHPEFWKDFPILLLDGCKFVKNKFLQLIGKGDGTGTYGGGGESSYQKV